MSSFNFIFKQLKVAAKTNPPTLLSVYFQRKFVYFMMNLTRLKNMKQLDEYEILGLGNSYKVFIYGMQRGFASRHKDSCVFDVNIFI